MIGSFRFSLQLYHEILRGSLTESRERFFMIVETNKKLLVLLQNVVILIY
jgi:hypothetical protein